MDIARDTTQDPSNSGDPRTGAAPDDGGAPPAREGELDRYSDEFADLVRQCPPARSDAPSDWLGRLPAEIYTYYGHGVNTFGDRAQTPAQHRGRLYLLHTALVLMWIEWGREGSRERLASQTRKGARRAAYLTTLEAYRRGGVLSDYEASGWFATPVGDWSVSVVSEAVATEAVDDADLRAAFEREPVVQTDMGTLSALRDAGAIPGRNALALAEGE
jgi:hypothetical protein